MQSDGCSPGSASCTGVRFSSYPKGEHIKDVVNKAVANTTDVGLSRTFEDVSVCLIGNANRLFQVFQHVQSSLSSMENVAVSSVDNVAVFRDSGEDHRLGVQSFGQEERSKSVE